MLIAKNKNEICSKPKTRLDYDIRKLWRVLVVVFIFMLLEIWGHWHSNSLSLLADSVHLLVDLLSFVVGLASLKWTKKASNSSMTFGYFRIEIIGAMISIFLIWGATFYLIIESYHKYLKPEIINGKTFLIISIVGFFVNVFCVFSLHEDKHDEGEKEHRCLNIRAAYVHVIGDMIQSIGIIIASIITFFWPKWCIVDIICTIIFSIMVLITTSIILKDGIYILAEGAPRSINYEELKNDILKLENIEKVTKIYLWSISANITAINLHIIIEDMLVCEYENVMYECKNLLRKKYKIDHITVQLETRNSEELKLPFYVGGVEVSDVRKPEIMN